MLPALLLVSGCLHYQYEWAHQQRKRQKELDIDVTEGLTMSLTAAFYPPPSLPLDGYFKSASDLENMQECNDAYTYLVNTLYLSLSYRTLTMFVRVVALRYQHHTIDNGVPQLPQT